MTIYGYAYKTCNCEDFPCCGHNDVDPHWQPDPYDDYEQDHDDSLSMCSLCDGDAAVVENGEPLCTECLAENSEPECCGRVMRRVDGHLVCPQCDYGSPR
jgi:hypothetical protein